MASFRAVVQDVVLDSYGYVDLFVDPPFECSEGLEIGNATIQGDPALTAPEGALHVATAVAVFPVSFIQGIVPGDRIHVSWRGNGNGSLNTLRIALA